MFLLLFASPFVLVSSFKIRREQDEKGMKSLLEETSKTAPESIDSKIHPFLTMEGQNAPRGASFLGHSQAKCKRDNFSLVIVFLGSEGRSRENTPTLPHNIK